MNERQDKRRMAIFYSGVIPKDKLTDDKYDWYRISNRSRLYWINVLQDRLNRILGWQWMRSYGNCCHYLRLEFKPSSFAIAPLSFSWDGFVHFSLVVKLGPFALRWGHNTMDEYLRVTRVTQEEYRFADNESRYLS